MTTAATVLTDCNRVSVRHEAGEWCIYGSFQSDTRGRYNGLLAKFDDVTDAVDFEVQFEQSRK
jgi:hypothetical protein